MNGNTADSTDEGLMEAYQRGESQAFDVLYARHSPRVYGYLRNRLHDRASADDVLQMVFLKFHAARHQYKSSLPFLPWLFTICRSVLIDQIRATGRVTETVAFDEERDSPLEARPAVDLVNLEALSPDQQRAIEMRYYQEKSFGEIAKALKISPAGIRQLVSRGVRRLSQILRPEGGRK
ncbi:MAG: hypothetical protein A2583_13645 [Bdellovibrionales bacterium RIFOXYD1_FULL_53_11]|nr:MAG: hypothetical protein A2583_13645 [Bdellovibrionales bacterium RIFOXYD1_FULL_53_11]